MQNFSSLNRLQILQDAQSLVFDLIIIGGGITGAGVALDAASRGLSVLLLEKNDFASGTSSKSTKLIHGGLRYLKQMEFNLVRQVGQERAILYKNAKHLVRPEKMLLPIIQGGSLGKISTSLALWLYEFLAGVPVNERKQMLDRQAALKTEPLLDNQMILGAALYTEYRTDDSRLTISVLKTAIQQGAKAVNYAQVVDLIKIDGHIQGVRVREKQTSREFNIRARCVVNAAGPWVDEIREIDLSLGKKKLHLTKGVHIVVPFSRCPLKQAVYFDTPDKRMIFAIPREGYTYIGTTDTNYTGNKDQLQLNQEEVNYLVHAFNELFPSCRLKYSDVISSWVGLRPLIHEEGKNPSELSRKDELFLSSSGMISIAGGKLTGYRLMAERVVNEVAKRMAKLDGRKLPKSQTQSVVLSGGDFKNEQDIIEYKDMLFGQSKQVGCDYKKIDEWVNRYGKEAMQLVEIAYSIWPEIQEKALVPDLAEIHYAVNNEMCLHPNDYFIRRTSALYFPKKHLFNSFEMLYPWFVKIAQLEKEISIEFANDFLKEMDSVLDFKITQ